MVGKQNKSQQPTISCNQIRLPEHNTDESGPIEGLSARQGAARTPPQPSGQAGKQALRSQIDLCGSPGGSHSPGSQGAAMWEVRKMKAPGSLVTKRNKHRLPQRLRARAFCCGKQINEILKT